MCACTCVCVHVLKRLKVVPGMISLRVSLRSTLGIFRVSPAPIYFRSECLGHSHHPLVPILITFACSFLALIQSF